MIRRSRSLSARSASSIALSRSGSSGRISAAVVTKPIESYPPISCDDFRQELDELVHSTRRGRHDGPPRLMDTPPIEPLQQGLQLGRTEPHHPVAYRRPAELAVFQALSDEHDAAAWRPAAPAGPSQPPPVQTLSATPTRIAGPAGATRTAVAASARDGARRHRPSRLPRSSRR